MSTSGDAQLIVYKESHQLGPDVLFQSESLNVPSVLQSGSLQVSNEQSVVNCVWLLCRVPSMELLGHGNIAHLLTLAQAQAASAPPAVLSAAALAASSSAVYAKHADVSLGRASAVDDACKCLLKAPMLSELHEWSSWHLLFEQQLGSLFDFLQDRGEYWFFRCFRYRHPAAV